MRRIFTLTMLLLVTVAAQGKDETSPNLDATIDFMNRMVLPEQRQIFQGSLSKERTSPEKKCTLTMISQQVVSNWIDFPRGHWSIWTDSDNSENEKEFPRYATFSLGDIDPATVQSHTAGFSAEYVKRFYDQHPGACKGGTQGSPECSALFLSAFDKGLSDITGVSLKTTDLKRTIERGALKARLDCEPDAKLMGVCSLAPVPNVTVDRLYFFFGDKDRAERFVTALKHAVNLCGGTDAQFPPTPQQ